MKKRMLVFLLAAALVLSFAACAGNEDNTTAPSDTGSVDTTVGSGEATEPTGSTGATTGGDETQPTETTEPTETTDGTEATEPSIDATEPVTEPSTEPSTQPTETTPPETEPTEGTKNNPISCYPDTGSEDAASTTMTLPQIAGGKSLYLNLYWVGGREIIIEDADAYVIYNGTKYTAKNGKVQFMTEVVSADKPQLVEIGNSGSSAKVFVLNCNSPSGTYENPEKIDSLDGTSYKLHIAKNAEDGYYYSFTADKTGTIKVVLESVSGDARGAIRLTNNNSMRCESNAEGDTFGGEDYVELPVTAGDIIEINVFTTENDNWERPAADIVWSGTYKG